MKKTHKMLFMSLLVAQALVLHIVEGMIPVPFIAPGAKLGLANIITVISLYALDFKATFVIIIVRLLMATMFGGSISSFLYSAAGAVLSFFAMYLVKEIGKDKLSIIGVSATGAVFHNIGQIFIAALIIQNARISLYLPVLTIAGIGTGFFVGLTCNYVLSYLKKISFVNKLKGNSGD